MKELPPGWARATGAEVFDFVTSGSRGWAQFYADAGAAFIRIGNLDHGTIALDLREVQRVRLPRNAEGERTRLKANDILISITAELGMIALVPASLEEAYINQHVALARPRHDNDPRYIAWYLASESDGKRQLLGMRRGATKAGLGLDDIRRIEIPLAPAAEQKRIADRLETLVARVDACREYLDRVPPLLKRFRQAVLAAATSGELTREWREAQALDARWPLVDLRSVATDFSYGSAAKSAKSGRVPVLRMGNLQDGQLDWDDLVYTSDAKEIAKYRLNAGDVLFNRTNSPELVGKTAVYRGDREALYAGYLIRVRCGERLLPDFLNYALGSPSGRDYCWRVKSDGVSQSNINAKKLAAFTFGLPTIPEQREIVRRVEDLIALATTLSARTRSASRLAERLAPAVLAKAFRGALVAQDSNDEPASSLVARILGRLEQQAAPSTSKRNTHLQLPPAMPTSDNETLARRAVAANHLTAILQEHGPLTSERLWTASRLQIYDFYDQLKDELAAGLLRETRRRTPLGSRLLESVK